MRWGWIDRNPADRARPPGDRPAELVVPTVEDVRRLLGAAEECTSFFRWYNYEHRHFGIGYHSAADVHYGRAEGLREKRAIVLDGAYQRHPERFVRRPPEPPTLPRAVWINQPKAVWINQPKEDPTTT